MSSAQEKEAEWKSKLEAVEEERAASAKAERECKARAARDKAIMLAKLNNCEPLDITAFNCARQSYLSGFESTLSDLNELADTIASLRPLPRGEESAPWRRLELAWQKQAS